MISLRIFKTIVIATILCSKLAGESFKLGDETVRAVPIDEIVKVFGSFSKGDALRSASDPLVSNGIRVPEEIAYSMPYNPDPSKVDPFSAVPKSHVIETETSIIGLLAPLIVSGDAESIPESFVTFSNSLPPTERDERIYNIGVFVIELMREVPSPRGFQGTTERAWEPLVNSKNSVYRYLALDGISRCSVPEQYQKYSMPYGSRDRRMDYFSAVEKFRLYKEYFDETDHHMLHKLYGALSSVPLEANLEYLRSQLSLHENRKDHELIKVLKVSIKNVEKMISSPPEGLPVGWDDPVTINDRDEVKAAEIVKEVSTTEPASEAPTEVIPTESIEESVEQSSNWWLWLLGFMLVVCSILSLRKKN